MYAERTELLVLYLKGLSSTTHDAHAIIQYFLPVLAPFLYPEANWKQCYMASDAKYLVINLDCHHHVGDVEKPDLYSLMHVLDLD